MIIVEGPDGAGKSTLVGQLEKLLGVTRQPRAVSSDAESLTPIDHYIEDELNKGFGLRLYDRFALISSPLYMHLPGRTFDGQMKDMNWLQASYFQFQRIDPVVILCLPSIEVVRHNVLSDLNNHVVAESIDTIYWNYHNWYAQRADNTSIMLYDYTLDPGDHGGASRDRQFQALIRWAQHRDKEGLKYAITR